MALKNNLTDRELAKFIELDGEHAVRVSSSDFLIEVAKGNIPDHYLVKKFGAHTGLSTNYEPITETGRYQTPNILTSLEIVSSSVNDAPAGSGALTVTVSGLGPGWVEINEDVVMNGTTPVTLVNQYYRVYRMRVKDSGTYASDTSGSHDSTISLSGVIGAEPWALIRTEAGLGFGSTEIGVLSIPTGYKGYLMDMHTDVEGTKVVDVVGFKRDRADIVTTPFSPMTVFFIKRGLEGEHFVSGAPLIEITGPADIGFMAKQSGGVSKVEIEFTILCVKI